MGDDIAKLQEIDFGRWEIIRPNSEEQNGAHSMLKDAARKDNDTAMVESMEMPSEIRGDGLTEQQRRYNEYYF
jgi:hypothetical protein